MKSILVTLLFMMFVISTHAQSFKTQSFRKIISEDDKYSMKGVVDIEDGHHDIHKVEFIIAAPADVWEYMVLKFETDERAFAGLAKLISLKAQYSLKNPLSFKPIKKQFVAFFDDTKMYTCEYKLLGRNGYGELTETTSMVYYDPVLELDTEEQALPKVYGITHLPLAITEPKLLMGSNLVIGLHEWF